MHVGLSWPAAVQRPWITDERLRDLESLALGRLGALSTQLPFQVTRGDLHKITYS